MYVQKHVVTSNVKSSHNMTLHHLGGVLLTTGGGICFYCSSHKSDKTEKGQGTINFKVFFSGLDTSP